MRSCRAFVEVERIRRFGEHRAFEPGEYLAKVGEPGLGLFVILGGAEPRKHLLASRLERGRARDGERFG